MKQNPRQKNGHNDPPTTARPSESPPAQGKPIPPQYLYERYQRRERIAIAIAQGLASAERSKDMDVLAFAEEVVDRADMVLMELNQYHRRDLNRHYEVERPHSVATAPKESA